MSQSGPRRRKGGQQLSDKDVSGDATNGSAAPVADKKDRPQAIVKVSDLIMMISLVFGGCCLCVSV